MVDTTKRGIDMISGVSEALKYRRENPKSSDEQVTSHIMNFLKNVRYSDSKVDVIAGVSHALKILAREPTLKDRQVIDRIMSEMKTIMPKD